MIELNGMQRSDELLKEYSFLEMQEKVQQTKEDVNLGEHYMGINGTLSFRCEKCKCWCLFETKHETGYRVCGFCEKNS